MKISAQVVDIKRNNNAVRVFCYLKVKFIKIKCTIGHDKEQNFSERLMSLQQELP